MMNQEKLLQDVAALPSIAQKEVIDFIAFLKLRYSQDAVKRKNTNLSDLENEPFIGMWENRSDMADSTSLVKDLRKKEWG